MTDDKRLLALGRSAKGEFSYSTAGVLWAMGNDGHALMNLRHGEIFDKLCNFLFKFKNTQFYILRYIFPNPQDFPRPTINIFGKMYLIIWWWGMRDEKQQTIDLPTRAGTSARTSPRRFWRNTFHAEPDDVSSLCCCSVVDPCHSLP